MPQAPPKLSQTAQALTTTATTLLHNLALLDLTMFQVIKNIYFALFHHYLKMLPPCYYCQTSSNSKNHLISCFTSAFLFYLWVWACDGSFSILLSCSTSSFIPRSLLLGEFLILRIYPADSQVLLSPLNKPKRRVPAYAGSEWGGL